MSSPTVFSALRRRKSPLAGAFFAPVGLSDADFIASLTSAAADLASSAATIGLHRRSSLSLVRKIKLLVSLLDFLNESIRFPLPPSVVLCFKEFYIALYRARALLEYCAQSSRVWALLQSPSIAGHFHEINLEIATLLDVLPTSSGELRLPSDAVVVSNLLRRHCRRSKPSVEPHQELLRRRVLDFLAQFEAGLCPDCDGLRTVFVDGLGICDAKTFIAEIEFLEEQIYSQEDDADLSLLGGVVALLRYSRFLLFGFEDDRDELEEGCGFSVKKLKKGGFGDTSIAMPKDFCCPISLDLMRDPVIVSTGHTYDRTSISLWMDEGRSTCPSSGLALSHTQLIPNVALRSLISQWCAANDIPYDPPDSVNSTEGLVAASASKATIEANKATAEILVKQLSCGSDVANAIAALELRLLAKTGNENRYCIAEAGAIPHLTRLLDSRNPAVQENSVTALLNISINDQNKHLIIEEEGCLTSIVNVLMNGLTTDARENAAAALFSLSAVHDYKKMIMDECGAVEALAGLLKQGSLRGKKDAVTALFNLSTHPECSVRMLESGAVSAIIGALDEEGVAEDAAGALALLMRRTNVVEVVATEDSAVVGLVQLMRRGSPRGKENAVTALQEMCRSGGTPMRLKVVKMPGFGGLIQSILFTGTKRARRKAASLARMYHRCEAAAAARVGGLHSDYELARSGSMRRESSYVRGDISVSAQMVISVPVL